MLIDIDFASSTAYAEVDSCATCSTANIGSSLTIALIIFALCSRFIIIWRVYLTTLVIYSTLCSLRAEFPRISVVSETSFVIPSLCCQFASLTLIVPTHWLEVEMLSCRRLFPCRSRFQSSSRAGRSLRVIYLPVARQILRWIRKRHN